MKNLLTIMVLYLLLTISQAWSLPPCEGDVWNNCYGTKNYEGDFKGYKYVGEWKNNKRHGQGIFTFGPGDREGDTYEGEFKDGVFHGQGTYTFRYGEWKGDKYVGEWKNDVVEGQGTYTWANGNKYVGGWKADVFHGKGTFTWANGDKFEGEYKDGKKYNGLFTFSPDSDWAGDTYEGQYNESEQMHGEGVYTKADGTTYVGIFKNDACPDCKVYSASEYKTMEDEKEIAAKFNIDNLPLCEKERGSEELYWDNCFGMRTFVGWDANGKMKYGGNIYVGGWKGNRPHGHGFFKWADDTNYWGTWKNTKLVQQGSFSWDGQGTFTYADGTQEVGEVIEGKLVKNAAGEYTGELGGRLQRENKSKEIEQANDNIRIALDALNYTFGGNKKERKIIVLDADNCIFEKDTWFIGGKQYDKFYLNNVIVDTIKFYSKNYYNEMYAQWMDAILISFSGDEPVFYHGTFQSENNEYEGVVSDSAELERVRKAWGVIYSKACKGADAEEF